MFQFDLVGNGRGWDLDQLTTLLHRNSNRRDIDTATLGDIFGTSANRLGLNVAVSMGNGEQRLNAPANAAPLAMVEWFEVNQTPLKRGLIFTFRK